MAFDAHILFNRRLCSFFLLLMTIIVERLVASLLVIVSLFQQFTDKLNFDKKPIDTWTWILSSIEQPIP